MCAPDLSCVMDPPISLKKKKRGGGGQRVERNLEREF